MSSPFNFTRKIVNGKQLNKSSSVLAQPDATQDLSTITQAIVSIDNRVTAIEASGGGSGSANVNFLREDW